jgi:methylmalonyl-CoA/ethylmalonyl-CoA epimerase
VLQGLEGLFGLGSLGAEAGPGFIERLFPVGDGYVQTLQVTGPGVVERFVKQRGPGLHHIAFEVDDIVSTLEHLRGQGARLVDEEPRTGGGGTRIAFVHPSSCGGLLVELVERKQEGP